MSTIPASELPAGGRRFRLDDVVLDRLAVTRPGAAAVLRRLRPEATLVTAPARHLLEFVGVKCSESDEFDPQVDSPWAAVVESAEDMRKLLGLSGPV